MEMETQGSPSPSRSSSSSSSFWIPTIDLTDPKAGQKLSVVCQDHGFFYLDGHGIPPSQLDALFHQAKALFDLPLSQKQKWTDPVLNRGYTALQEQTLDPKHQTEGDTKEGYYIGTEVPRDSKCYNPQKLSGPNTWPDPDVLPDFRTVLQEYHATATQVAMRVVRLIAEGLGLPTTEPDATNDNTPWEADFEHPIATLRLIHYDSKVSDPDRGIFACGAHKDFGILTLLLTDHHPGLQVYHQQEWRDVPPKPHSFVVNVGDMLQIWTNGQYKSSLHRVLTKPRTSETEHEHKHDDGEDRYSIPFFFEPTFDATLQCLDVCVDEEHPPKYKKTTCGEFLLAKFRNTHADFEQ